MVEGGLTYDNILALEDKLAENEFEPNAFISNRKNRTELRSAAQTVGSMLSLFMIALLIQLTDYQ